MVSKYSPDLKPVSHRLGVEPRIKVRTIGTWAVLALAFFVCYILYGWVLSPERQLQRFVAASRHNDATGMLSLADPSEVRRMGVGAREFGALMRDATGSTQPVFLSDPIPEPLNAGQSQYNRWLKVTVRDKSGNPLRSKDGSAMMVIVQAYNMGGGWRIGLTNFLYALLCQRDGMENRRQHYAEFCVSHEMPAELFWPSDAHWEQVKSLQTPPR